MVLDLVSNPVAPSYNWTYIKTLYSSPLMIEPVSIDELVERKAVSYGKMVCLTHTRQHGNFKNHMKTGFNESLREDPWFIPNTTYWVNDYLHVGHVHYDIVLLQVFQSMKVDRIIMQRAACHGTLCTGLGTLDSFYKGYYAALFEAFGQPHVPVYIRWSWREMELNPFYFSTETEDYYYMKQIVKTNPDAMQKFKLNTYMCFEKVVRRVDTQYGAIPTVSVSAVQKFKDTAYRMVRAKPPLTTYFGSGPPYRILFSHRGPRATRRIENQESFISLLRNNFQEPDYILRILNNSDPMLDFPTQLQAVAESHVVITNHGAFEGNMIYMKNSSLLLEIFGNYGNNEIHTFHRLALMFGVYYGRVHPQGLTDHKGKSFNITDPEMNEVIGYVKEYFQVKPYLHNSRGSLA